MGIHGNTWEYVGIRVFPGLFEASGNTWQTVGMPWLPRILLFRFSRYYDSSLLIFRLWGKPEISARLLGLFQICGLRDTHEPLLVDVLFSCSFHVRAAGRGENAYWAAMSRSCVLRFFACD